MNNLHDNFECLKLMDKLQKVASGGWLIANLTERKIICSAFVLEKFKFNDGEIPFDEVINLLHPDDQENAIVGLELLSLCGTVDTIVRIRKVNKYIPLRVKFGEAEQKDNQRFSYGIVHVYTSQDHFPLSWNIFDLCRELKYWQETIPGSFRMLLEQKELKQLMLYMLQPLLGLFRADRVYLFEYSEEANLNDCSCMVTNEGVFLEKDRLMHIAAFRDGYLDKGLEPQRIVAVDNYSLMPRGEFRKNPGNEGKSTLSFMLGPMGICEKVWGYLTVEVIDRERHWTEREKEWFRRICNIISICLELRSCNPAESCGTRELKSLQTDFTASKFFTSADDFGVSLHSGIPLNEEPHKNRNESMNQFQSIGYQNQHAIHEREPIPSEAIEQKESEGILFENEIFNDIIFDTTVLYDDNGCIHKYNDLFERHKEVDDTYAKLRETQERFSLVSEFSEVGFSRFNIMNKGLTYEATDQWFKNLNISREDTNFASGLIPNTIHSHDVAGIRRFMNEAINGQETEYSKEIRVYGNQGMIHWLRLSIKVIEHNPEENRVILSGLSVDITSQKNIEKVLHEAKMKIEESDKLKSAFLANMSHEIRTPLNAIVGFSNMIADDPTNDCNEEFATLVKKNNELLLQIISDVLDLAQIDAGVFEKVISRNNVNRLCEDIIESFCMQTGQCDKIIFIPEFPEYHILCDQRYITQILNNFLSNALKFCPHGKIELGYHILHEENQELIEFYVRDTGKGMSLEQTQKCFNRFYKADNFIQGTGLGLSICKEIVEKLNGSIGVHSIENEGSRFWFRLPFTPAISEKELNDKYTVFTSDGRKPVILVAEDTMKNFLLTSSMLMQYYTVIIVQNGFDAVRVHAEKAPDLILMDLKMAKMDGIEAVRQIRKKDKKTPIIAITTFIFENDRLDTLEAGFNHILVKPVDQLQLRKTVKEILQSGATH